MQAVVMSVLPEYFAGATDEEVAVGHLLVSILSPDIERCAGLVLRHSSGRLECTEDPACAADPVVHLGSVECVEVLADCCR